MKYNWNWGIFGQTASDGSGTWLYYLVSGLGWTLAVFYSIAGICALLAFHRRR